MKKDVTISVAEVPYDLGKGVADLVLAIKKAAEDGLDMNDIASVAPETMALFGKVQKAMSDGMGDSGEAVEALMVSLAGLPDAFMPDAPVAPPAP